MADQIERNKTWQKQRQQLKKVNFSLNSRAMLNDKLSLMPSLSRPPSNIVRDVLGLKNRLARNVLGSVCHLPEMNSKFWLAKRLIQ